MKLSDFARRAPAYYRSGISVHLKSSPGRGKSTVTRDAAKLIGEATGKKVGFRVLMAPAMTVVDTIGYLIPGRDEHGNATSSFTKPYWWVTEEGKRLDEYDGGIIFVDELDKADSDVKKLLGEMTLSGEIGMHKLPPGWVVWTAGNLATDRSGSTKDYDHLINRRLEISVDDDVNAWNEWAAANGVPPVAIAFVNDNTHVVFSEGVPEKQGPWCTPRSLVRCVQHLMTFAHDGESLPMDDLAKEDAAGMIGQAAAAQLFATIQIANEMPKFAEIVADPTGVKVPSNPSAQMLVAYTLASKVAKDTIDPVLKYIERMPKEFGALFGRAAVTRDKSLVYTKAITDWISRNATLMNAIIAK